MSHVRLLIIAACGVVVLPGQTYTEAQAAAGRSAYQANCAGCHLPNLGGRNEAPQLAGSGFMRAWGGRTTGDLLAYLKSTMPPGNPGSLSQEVYVNLVAFLLQANGAMAGSRPLGLGTNSLIRSVATGEIPASVRRSLSQTPAETAAPVVSRPRGLTVSGEV